MCVPMFPDLLKPKLTDDVIKQTTLKIVKILNEAVEKKDKEDRFSRLMVAFHHFQNLMNMLTCNSNSNLENRNNSSNSTNYSRRPRISTPSSEISASNYGSRLRLSTPSSEIGASRIALPAKATPYGSPRLSSPRIPVRSSGGGTTPLQRSPDVVSRSLHCSPIRRTDPVLFQNSFHGNQQAHSVNTCYSQKPIINVVSPKPVLKRPNYNGVQGSSLIPYRNDATRGYVRQNVNSQSNRKNFEEFSRYRPLPAINGAEKSGYNKPSRQYLEEGDSRVANNANSVRKLRRQLTYKVLKPVFVKGPSDMKNGSEMTSCQERKLAAKKMRNRTVVIRRGDIKSCIPRQQRVSDEGYLEGSESADRSVDGLKSRLRVRKDLIEAGEKLKNGISSHENAFWFEI